MKILWLGHNLAYPPKGGALQRNYNLLRGAAAVHEIHMLAFDRPITRPPGIEPEDCVRALSEFCETVEVVPIPQGMAGTHRHLAALKGIMTRDPYEIHWLRSRKFARRLQGILKRVSFDVVHFDTIGLTQYRPLVASAAAVLNHHDIESVKMTKRSASQTNVFMRWFWCDQARKFVELEKQWCRKFNVNIVVSQEEDDELQAIVPGVRTSIVPNGVDITYFTPRPDPGGHVLLFCGTLDLFPNQDAVKYFFESIWPMLSSRIKDIEIYIVGRKPPLWLHNLSKRDTRVHVTGFVDDVRPYFRMATAFICPVRTGGGTRLKILDSLAMGVPIVGTTFAASGLKLQDGRHILFADSPEEFAKSVERVLRDKPIRVELAAAGVDIVTRYYSWRVVERKLIEVYEQAAKFSYLFRPVAEALHLPKVNDIAIL